MKTLLLYFGIIFFSLATMSDTPPTPLVWGMINGTLSNQTDLQSALDGKLPFVIPGTSGNVLTSNGTIWTSAPATGGGGTWGSITGTLSNQTDLQDALNLKADLTSIMGTPNTMSGYDGSGNLESLGEFNLNADIYHGGALTFSNTVNTAPDDTSDNFYAITGFNTQIIPTASTVFRHPLVFSPHVSIDPNNSGFDINSVHLIDSFNSFDGSGTLGQFSLTNLFMNVDGGGTITDYDAVQYGVQFGAGTTVTHAVGLTISADFDPAANNPQGYVGMFVNGSYAAPMGTSGFEGVIVNPQLSSTMNFMSSFNSESDFATGTVINGGIQQFNDQASMDVGSTAQNYTSYGSFPNLNGTITNGYTAYASGAQVHSAMQYANGYSASADYYGAISGGASIFTDYSHVHGGAAYYQSFNANPLFDSLITGQYTGLNIGPAAGSIVPTNGFQGVNVDFTNFMQTPQLQVGLNLNQATINQNVTLDTQYIDTSGVYGINQIGGTVRVSSGFPVTGGFGILNNIGIGLDIKDNVPTDFTGADLGMNDVGILTQVSVDAGKTLSTFGMMTAGAGIAPGSSGNMTNVSMFRALGLLPEGGSLNVTNLYAFKADPILAAAGATNAWAFYDGAGLDNYFSRVAIGTGNQKVSNGSVGLEIGSTTQALRLSNLTDVQETALTPLSGMVDYNTTSSAVKVYNGTNWTAVGGGGGSSQRVIKKYTITFTDVKGGTPYDSGNGSFFTLDTYAIKQLVGQVMGANVITPFQGGSITLQNVGGVTLGDPTDPGQLAGLGEDITQPNGTPFVNISSSSVNVFSFTSSLPLKFGVDFDGPVSGLTQGVIELYVESIQLP